MITPKVSVVIPTHNRPGLLGRAISSVLAQTFQNFEVIVVDDGTEKRAEEAVRVSHDDRIRYIKNEKSLGGGGARNVGIRAAKGEYVAFLDDDDEWAPEKLKVQMRAFEKAPEDAGFCFSAVTNVFDDKEEDTSVEDGIKGYSEISFARFKGFLTVTLVIKKKILEEFGGFDETLPSHQDPELILRIAQKYKGIGVNRPLVRVNMKSGRNHIGGDLKRRIAGREMVLQKHKAEFAKRPNILAQHYFWIGLWHRDGGNLAKAREYFKKAAEKDFKPRYGLHYASVLFGRFPRLIFKNKFFQTFILMAIGLSFLVFLLHKVNFSDVREALRTSDKTLLFFSGLALFSTHVLAAARWQYLLRILGHHFSFKEILISFLANIPVSKILPLYSGTFGRTLQMRDRVPMSKNAGIIFFESFLDVVVLGMFVLFGAYALSLNILFWSGIAAIFAVALVTLFLSGSFFTRFAGRRAQIKNLLEVFQTALAKPSLLFVPAFFTFLMWIVTIVFVKAVFSAFGIDISFGRIFAVQPAVTFISLLPITIGGVGTREALMLLFYSGVAPAPSILATGLWYSFLSIIVFSLIGLPFFLREIAGKQKK
jgi:uncharacterized protein (TIRG00374 family)